MGYPPLSVMSGAPNRLHLLQVLQGPAQTAVEHLSSRRDLLSFLPPVPPELLHTLVLVPAILPLFFFSFFSLLIKKPLLGGNSSPAQPATSWDIPDPPSRSAQACCSQQTLCLQVGWQGDFSAVFSCWPVGSASPSLAGLAQNISGCFRSSEMLPIYCC